VKRQLNISHKSSNNVIYNVNLKDVGSSFLKLLAF